MKKYRGKWKRSFAILLGITLLMGQIELPVYAEEPESVVVTQNFGLCEHHPEHNADCGYIEPVEGQDCSHKHTDECYKEVTNCVHEHIADCYQEGSIEGEPTLCTHECSEESGCVIKELDCNHEHDESCGYIEAVKGQHCAFVCEECSKEEPQEKENDTVSGNTLNNSDPVTVSGNDIIPVTSDAVKEVQDVIDALPTVEEVKAMNTEDRNAAYTQAQMAYEAYEALPEEEQSQVDTTKVEALSAYFNDMVSLAAEAGPFTITKNGSPADVTTDYTWDDTAKKLTINTTENLTISMAEGQTTPATATIVAGNGTDDQQIDLNLTLAGVNITAPVDYSALATTGTLTITLQGDNTLTGGSSSSSSYGIYAKGALSIGGGGTLHAVGGGVTATSSNSTGIFSETSITIDGGTVEATAGTSSGNSYGIYVRGNSTTITIKGATVTATGGNANTTSCGMSASGEITIENSTVTATGGIGTNSHGIRASQSNITINSGNVTATGNTTGIQGSFSTGTDGKAIIHASSISDQSGKNNWKGIIFEGKTDGSTGYTGTVYGEQTLEKNFTVNAGEVLTIPAGTTLTLGNGVTLTNSGTINNYGTIDATKGTFTQSGSLTNNGKIIRSDGVEVGPFAITKTDGGALADTDYEWNGTDKKLTINTDTALTISTPNNDANNPAPACITAKNTSTVEGTFTYGPINLTLDGVHITAQDGGSALGSDNFNTSALKGGAVNLTLQGSNTLTGGNTTNKSSYGICAKGALTINGYGSLTATGGTVSANDTVRVSAGIYSETSITIEGGTVVATGGASEGTNGVSCGIYASNGSSNATITIKAGNVTATGGSATIASCGMSANSEITIENGTVTATGGAVIDTSNGNRQSYGIRSTQSNITITGGTGTATTSEGSATNKGAMNKAPDFTNVGSKQANTDTTMNWGPVPSITAQPGNATVNAGENATFIVAAENASTYKWQVKKGKAEWADVDGATAASYTTGATTVAMNGWQYRCVVDNEYGSVESNTVTLTVTYAVTYNGNGADSGSVPADATSYNSGAQVTVLGNTGNLAKTGYIFGGWNTESDGTGTDYAEGDILTITANTTLYAKWEAKPEEPKPEEPTTPEQPVEPEKPVEPTTPVEPEQPVEPEKPVLADEEYQGTEPVAEELIKKVKSGKNYNKIYWDKVKDADGYYIYAAPCNTKKKKQGAKLVKDIESDKTTSFTHKGLKKGTWYKYRVVAYKISDGRKVTIAQSFLLHAVTSGGKYVNPKDVKVNKSKVTLKKGKSFTVNAKVVLAKGKKTKWHTKKIHFISSDTKIATVNSKGKIRAKKKGRCTIYAIAQNGVSKKIKVTVK